MTRKILKFLIPALVSILVPSLSFAASNIFQDSLYAGIRGTYISINNQSIFQAYNGGSVYFFSTDHKKRHYGAYALLVGYGTDFDTDGFYFGLEGSALFTQHSGTVDGNTRLEMPQAYATDLLLGYVFVQRWLVYLRAGAQYIHYTLVRKPPNSGVATQYNNNTTNSVGLRLGLGAEYQLSGNWILTAGYTYVAMEPHTFTQDAIAGVTILPFEDVTRINPHFNLFYLGLTIRINT